MVMTSAQLATLKAAIRDETDPTFASARSAGATSAMADFYNQPASPQVFLWRPDVPIRDLVNAIIFSELEAATVAKRDVWSTLIGGDTIDATKANIRAGFALVFAGTPGSVSVTNLTAAAQRPATRFEALFTAGNVSSVFGQSLSGDDIIAALR